MSPFLRRARNTVLVVAFVALALGSAAWGTQSDNSIFVRAWQHAFPASAPLVEQGAHVQLAAKQYGEAVLWAQQNPDTGPAPSAGWTDLPVAADAHLIYVSSSTGNDANDGTLEHPERTIEEGKRQLRDGFPDRLLLKAGDTFVGNEMRWVASGRSAGEPVVFGVYGEGPRPVLQFKVSTFGNDPLRFVAFVGFELGVNQAGEGGLNWNEPGESVLFEDLLIRHGSFGMVVQNASKDTPTQTYHLRDVRVRRCIVVDQAAPASEGHVQGGYFYRCEGLLIEQCVIDNNGAPADIFRHGLYVQNFNTGVSVIDCWISRNSSHGLQLRCGGVVRDCVFWANPISLSVGGGNHVEHEGVLASVSRCVFLNGGDIDMENRRGWGPGFMNIRGGRAWDNVLVDGTGGFQFPLMVGGNFQDDDGFGFGVHGLVIEGNVRRGWACSDHPDRVEPGYLWQGTPEQLSGSSVSSMQERGDLAGIDVSPETYMPGFLERARNRGRGEWDEANTGAAYVAWAREQLHLQP